jgi:PAS domain S-box-containing protein
VEWSIFVEFMKRLEREVGGPEGVETCGGFIAELEPAAVLRGLAGFAASPVVLYRGAIRWALQRALPGVETRISPPQGNQIVIHATLAPSLQPCPQIFHFATGGARALPRVLGMADAVVSAEIGDREATYRITLPPSLTLFARLRRLLRSVFSAGAVLEFLERQQLELHAQYDALERTHAALAASEQLHRARTDAAADVVCEIDAQGRIVYASASVQDLIGYRPEQVIGSHYRLWVPKDFHALADARFAAIASRQLDGATCQELVELHADHGQRIQAEISIRSYQTPDGEWRLVGVVRDRSDRKKKRPTALSRAASIHPARGQERRGIDELRDRLTRFDRSFGTPDGVDPSRRAPAPHPLHHSLQILIAALERVDPDGDVPSSDRLAVATRAMARIADGALARSEDPNAHADWIETRKLLDRICGRVAERPGEGFESAEARGLALIPDDSLGASVGPPEIWGRIDLLEHAIGSLTDHAVFLASLRRHRDPISIGVRTWGPQGGRSGVEFVLHLPTSTAPRGHAAAPMDLDEPRAAVDAVDASERSALSLAIARDAARLLDGELLIDEPDTGVAGDRRGGHRLRLRIPQPTRDQSSSRTMSAPIERSFSSTRS